MVRKTIVIGVSLFVIACGFTHQLVKHVSSDGADQSSFTQTQKTPMRKVPDSANMGAYLAALLARDNADIQAASTYYAKALAGDPENESLQSEAYLISAFAGDMDQFMDVAKVLKDRQRGMFSNIALATESLKNKEYERVLSQTKKSNLKEMSSLVYPQVRAWAYVGLGDKEKALEALDPITADKDLQPLYLYNKALVLSAMGDADGADQAFIQLVGLEMPAVTVMLAIRQFYIGQGRWNDQNPLFEKYYQTVKDNPSLVEVLIARANEFEVKTPQQGVAESFYIVSAVAGKHSKSPETSLLFNALALYLNPNGTIYKIWGAEQFESAKYYAEANRLYQTISNPSDIILFKGALNLMLMNNYPVAEKVLLDVYTRQPNDRLLLVMLGDLYKDQLKLEESTTFYTKAIRLLKQTDDKKALAKVLFSRASVYDAMGWQAKTESDLKEALAVTPDDPLLLNYIGYMWIDSGKNMDEAMKYIQSAVALTPDEPHIIDSLAWGYYKQGKYEKALKYAEQSADKLPYSSAVQSHLGDIYKALGRQREAKYQYRKALESKADLTPQLKKELEEKLK